MLRGRGARLGLDVNEAAHEERSRHNDAHPGRQLEALRHGGVHADAHTHERELVGGVQAEQRRHGRDQAARKHLLQLVGVGRHDARLQRARPEVRVLRQGAPVVQPPLDAALEAQLAAGHVDRLPRQRARRGHQQQHLRVVVLQLLQHHAHHHLQGRHPLRLRVRVHVAAFAERQQRQQWHLQRHAKEEHTAREAVLVGPRHDAVRSSDWVVWDDAAECDTPALR
mmetsp:Transcript_5890/g.14906  ORF Transcript_5890/g.14906 Transcript_5890/m.14906 type:complete len:225 (+) Transcript_5890:899-1573(+)